MSVDQQPAEPRRSRLWRWIRRGLVALGALILCVIVAIHLPPVERALVEIGLTRLRVSLGVSIDYTQRPLQPDHPSRHDRRLEVRTSWRAAARRSAACPGGVSVQHVQGIARRPRRHARVRPRASGARARSLDQFSRTVDAPACHADPRRGGGCRPLPHCGCAALTSATRTTTPTLPLTPRACAWTWCRPAKAPGTSPDRWRPARPATSNGSRAARR